MTTTTSSPVMVCARIAERLAEQVGPQRYNMWFSRTAKLAVEETGDTPCLEVTVPNQFVAEWIARHFDEPLSRIAESELGAPVDVKVRVTPAAFDQAAVTARQALPAKPARTSRPAQPSSRLLDLDHFIVGTSNELAYAAACRVAEGDDTIASPLFVHGACGVGKTHLLQGICKRYQALHPQAKVLYTTAERFTNEFVAAIQKQSTSAFRNRIRKLDILAVDDVHVFANKSATQQEFLCSLDAIELGGARIVMACDQHPRELQEFTPGLISRCLKGMVVEVDEPDTPTRARIVEAIANRRGMGLVPAVIQTIANRCIGSVREIEGTLTKLDILARMSDEASEGEHKIIGHALVDRLFRNDHVSTKRHAVTFDDVFDEVADASGLTRVQILGGSRQRDVVLARSVTIHLARKLTAKSYPEIATAMGKTSHSTIIAANNRVEEQMAAGKVVTFGPDRETIAMADLVDRLRLKILRG